MSFDDVVDGMKERLSNPFFLAFIIAWITFNPEVTVALIWYDTEQLAKEGYKTIYQLLGCKISTERAIVFPLVSAVGYTLLGKNIILWINTIAKKGGDVINERITGQLESFRKAKDRTFDSSLMDGKWRCVYPDLENAQIFLEISSGNITIQEDVTHVRLYSLHDFAFNQQHGTIFFTKYLVPDAANSIPKNLSKFLQDAGHYAKHYIIVSLQIQDKNHLSGHENVTTKVKYNRIS